MFKKDAIVAEHWFVNIVVFPSILKMQSLHKSFAAESANSYLKKGSQPPRMFWVNVASSLGHIILKKEISMAEFLIKNGETLFISAINGLVKDVVR